MDILNQLAVALGFATLAGLNLYLTVLVTGLAIRMDWIQLSSQYDQLSVLGSDAVLIAAGFLDSVVLESQGRRLMVKGRTYKVWIDAHSPDPNVDVQREVLRTTVTVLDLRSGELQVVDTGGARS